MTALLSWVAQYFVFEGSIFQERTGDCGLLQDDSSAKSPDSSVHFSGFHNFEQVRLSTSNCLTKMMTMDFVCNKSPTMTHPRTHSVHCFCLLLQDVQVLHQGLKLQGTSPKPLTETLSHHLAVLLWTWTTLIFQ